MVDSTSGGGKRLRTPDAAEYLGLAASTLEKLRLTGEGRSALDSRLERLIRSPAIYSSEFASLTIAEQEHWLKELAEHSVEVGRTDEALRQLRQAGDRRAQELATAFSTQLRLVAAMHREVASAASSEAASRAPSRGPLRTQER